MQLKILIGVHLSRSLCEIMSLKNNKNIKLVNVYWELVSLLRMLVRMFSISHSNSNLQQQGNKLNDLQGVVSIFAYFDDSESSNISNPIDAYVEKDNETIGILRKGSLGNPLKHSEKSVKFNEFGKVTAVQRGPIVEALIHNYKVNKFSRLHDLLAILLPRWQTLTEKVLLYLSSHQHESETLRNRNNMSAGANHINKQLAETLTVDSQENVESRSKFKSIFQVALEYAKQIGISPNYEQGAVKSESEVAFFFLDDATSSFDGHGNEDYWRTFSTLGIPIHTVRIASSSDIYEDDLRYIQDSSTLELISTRTNGVHLLGRDIVEFYTDKNEFFLFQQNLSGSLSAIKQKIIDRKKGRHNNSSKQAVYVSQHLKFNEGIFPWEYRSNSKKPQDNDISDAEHSLPRPADMLNIAIADYRFICPINELIQRRLNDGFVVKDRTIIRLGDSDRYTIGYKVSLQWSLIVTIDYFARSKVMLSREAFLSSDITKELFGGFESSPLEHTSVQIRIAAPSHFLKGFLLVQQRSKEKPVEKFERALFIQLSLHECILSLIASDKVYSHMMIKSPIIPQRKSSPTVGTGLVLQSLPVSEWSRYINKFKDIDIVVSSTRSLKSIQRCLHEWSSSNIPGKLFIWESNNMKFSCIAAVTWAQAPYVLTIRIAYARSSIDDDKNISNIEFSHNNDFNSAIEDLCNKLALEIDVAYIFKSRPVYPLISDGLISQSILSNRSSWPLSYFGISSLTLKSAIRMILKARSREGFIHLASTHDKGVQTTTIIPSIPVPGLHHNQNVSYSQNLNFLLVVDAEPIIKDSISKDEELDVQSSDVFDNSFIVEKVRTGDLQSSLVVKYALKSVLSHVIQQNSSSGEFSISSTHSPPSNSTNNMDSTLTSQTNKTSQIQGKLLSSGNENTIHSNTFLRRGSSNI